LHNDVQQPFVIIKVHLKIKGEEEIVVNVGHDVKRVKKFWTSMVILFTFKKWT
jgi:hypothetical protein